MTPTEPDLGAAGAADSAQPPARRRLAVLLAVASVALAADVVSKIVVVSQLSHRAPVRLLGGGIYLLETRNAGAAFSVGTGETAALTIVALAVVAFILRAARRLASSAWAVSLGLILGGALGNLSDRLLRAPGVGHGHVVDWISLFSNDGHVWPVFNLADSAVVCGAVLAAILALLGHDLTTVAKQPKQAKPRTQPSGQP